ncbi:MAG TPA: M1 family aminopeptidase [Longimicrobiales bacterium]|nr:M1 family aminopeptidase [Longimicrobiales bacterium]
MQCEDLVRTLSDFMDGELDEAMRGRARVRPPTSLPFWAMLALLGCGGSVPAPPSPAPTAPAMDPPPLEQQLVPGVSVELARWRAATLSDVEYDLALELTDTARAAGEVLIAVTRSPRAGDLVLDFRGPALHAVSANEVALEPEWRDGHLRIPAAALVTGPNRIRIRFSAAIAPAGAAIIRFDEPDTGERFLYTLLVPSDAQQLFPSFDQPDLKAGLRLRLVVPEGWEVLANAPLAARVGIPGGSMRWEFSRTEPISTYVRAFAAGPWDTVRERPNMHTAPGDPPGPMTLYLRPSRRAEADTDTLLALNRQGLEWLEDYFQMEYPFGKLDLLLAPAFPFGGMEHVGAIFYNESRFIFREPPTLSARLGRAATIYHEVAHQWFGDLVTMTWFDDLWLKEGFSTYMAAKIQQELHPGTGAWKTFYLRNKPAAYAVDATTGTTPVWQELPNLDLAKSNYGAIVYNKAPSVLKQLEFLVGDTAFRAGVGTFLERHAYGNATWRDLLAAVGEAAATDLTAFGEHYMLRAGMPLVETELRLEDGRIAELALVQRPVVALPGDPGGAWPGRVRVRLGYAGDDVVLPVTFDGARTVVSQARGRPAPEFVWPNDGDFGYGTFLPDPRSAAWLLEHVGGIEDDLLRAMGWGALWDLVRERRLAAGDFVERALLELADEEDEQIASAVLGRAAYALERYLTDAPTAERLAAQLEELLLARATDPSLPYGLRKGALDAFLGSARTAAGMAALHAFLAGERRFDGDPLAQPSRWRALTRLLALGDPGADALYAAEQARDTTPEAARMAFIAGAAVPTADNKAAYFRRYFEDETLNEEWVTASLSAFNEPLHRPLVLPYLRPALERAEWIRDNRRIFFLPSWLSSFIGAHASRAALGEVDAYLAASPDLPADLRRRILQERDELARAVQVREEPPAPLP